MEYSSGERIELRHIFSEVQELLVEIVRFNPAGISEEFGDVLHFVQLWLYWRFGIDGEIWLGLTGCSVRKFMDRRAVWRRLYKEVGLPEGISNFCGNCSKVEKVVKQLGRFGVDRQTATAAYQKTILAK